MNSDTALGWLPSGTGFRWAVVLGVFVAVVLRELIERTHGGRRIIRVAHLLEGSFVAALLAAMLILSFLQIVLRNVFKSGIVWIDPLLRHLLLWIGFTGGALATRLGRHITVDAITRMMSERTKRWARVATSAGACIVCFVLASSTLEVVREEAAAGTTGFLDLPIWWLQSIMPLALLLMAYRFLRQAFDATLGRASAGDAVHVPIGPEDEQLTGAAPALPVGESGRA